MSKVQILTFLVNYHAAREQKPNMSRLRGITKAFRSLGVSDVDQLLNCMNSSVSLRDSALKIFDVGLSTYHANEIYEALLLMQSDPTLTIAKALQHLDKDSVGVIQKGKSNNFEMEKSKEQGNVVPKIKELFASSVDDATDNSFLNQLDFDNYSNPILKAEDTNVLYSKKILRKQGICFDYMKSVSTGGRCKKGRRCPYHHITPAKTVVTSQVRPLRESKETISVSSLNTGVILGKIANANAKVGLNATPETVCFSYANHGQCWNARCRFIHDPNYIRLDTSGSMSTKSSTDSTNSKKTRNSSISDHRNICFDFANKGFCVRENCLYEHKIEHKSDDSLTSHSSLSDNQNEYQHPMTCFPTSFNTFQDEDEYHSSDNTKIRPFAQPFIPQSAASESNSMEQPYYNNNLLSGQFNKDDEVVSATIQLEPSSTLNRRIYNPSDLLQTMNQKGPVSYNLDTFNRSMMTDGISAADLNFGHRKESEVSAELSVYLETLLNE